MGSAIRAAGSVLVNVIAAGAILFALHGCGTNTLTGEGAMTESDAATILAGGCCRPTPKARQWRGRSGRTMKFGDYVKVKSLQTAAGFRENLQRLGLDMPCDDVLEAGPASPMAAPLQVDGLTIGMLPQSIA